MYKIDIIEGYADILPPDSVYFDLARRRQHWGSASLARGGLRAIVLQDLGFGMRLPDRYASTGGNLPLGLQRGLLFRAFKYLTSVSTKDPDMVRAQTLWASKGKRLLLKATLTARDAPLVQIADWCGTTPRVIVLVMRLYWNIRIRWQDVGFMIDLLQLNVRHPVFLPEDSEFQQLTIDEHPIVRASYKRGICGIVKALDLPSNSGLQFVEALAEFREEAGRALLAGGLQGHFSLENNDALEGLQLLGSLESEQARKEKTDDDALRGLTALSLSEATGEAARRIHEGDLKRRLALQTGMALDDAAKDKAQIESGQPTQGTKDGVAVGIDGFPEALPAADKKDRPAGATS